MSSRAGGQEVVQRDLVREIEDGEPSDPLRPFRMEQVIRADGQVQYISWRHTRWIFVSVVCAWGWHVDQICPVVRTARCDRICNCCDLAAAIETNHLLLVRRECEQTV